MIDFSPYWRPPAFADAVVVGGALLWESAGETLLDEVAEVPISRNTSSGR